MNLETAGKLFRLCIKLILAFVAVYYLWTLLILPGGMGLYKTLFPPKNPPKPVFGKLAALEFTQKKIQGNPVYELNTKTGGLPTKMPDKIEVYRMLPAPFSYEAGQAAEDDAAKLGFTDKDLITDIKGNVYSWKSLQTGGTLTIDIITKDLVLSTDLRGKQELYGQYGMSREGAKKIAEELLTTLGRFDSLYANGYQKIYLGKYSNGRVVETNVVAEAQLARVDFFRRIGDTPILGPDAGKAPISLTTSIPKTIESPENYPMAEVYYKEVESKAYATYPLITVQQAWEAVKEGRGVISGITPKNQSPFENYTPEIVDRILVNNIYLAYYETPKYNMYLQPIYVFEGNYTSRGNPGGSITIYFPAIAAEYIKTSD